MSWKDLHVLGVDALGLVTTARRITAPVTTRAAAPTVPSAASRVVAPPTRTTETTVSTPVSRTIESAVNTAAAVEAAIRAAVPPSSHAAITSKIPASRGAGIASKVASKASQASVNSAASRAIAAGKKLATRVPGAGNRLVSMGQKGLQKATTIKGLDGVYSQETTYSADATASYKLYTDTLNALSAAADIGNTLSPIIDKMTAAGLTDVAAAGKAIVQRCADLINNTPDPAENPPADESVANAVASIQADASAWTTQSQTAVQTAATSSFDPGSAGGGGGGGGGSDDSSSAASSEADATDVEPPEESEATARFRESGGADDALSDEDQTMEPGQSLDDEGTTDQSAESLDDDEGLSTSSDAIQRFRQSAGTDDALEGLTSSDYHFEAEDIFLPHQALIRTYQDAEAKKYTGEGYTGAPPTTMAPRSNDQPSPAVAAKLAAAQKRLSDAQKKLTALHTAQLKAAGVTTDPNANAKAVLEDDGGQTVMGDFDEADDLFYGGHQQQITDDEADFERAHGSVHRGAAYLQSITYPPHGASGGQEGGSVDPNEKIEVFGAGYHRGLDALGASPALNAAASQAASSRAVGQSVAQKLGASSAGVKAAGAAAAKVTPRASFALKTTPAGNKHVALVLASTKTHKTSIANAKDVGKRAISVGNKLLKALNKPGALAKPTKVHGLVKKLTGRGPHKAITHAQMKKIAENAVKSGRSLIARADKHQQLVTKDQARVSAGIKSVQGQTHIRGDESDLEILGVNDVDIFGEENDIDVFGAACVMLGMEVDDLAADVIFGGDDGSDPTVDDGSGTVSDGSASGGGVVADPTAGPPDYGLGPAPTVAPPFLDFVPGPDPYHDAQTYDSTGAAGTPPPLGYVVYDGSRRFGFMDLGSLNVFTPGAASSDPEGGGNSGFQIHKDGWWFNWGGDNQRPSGGETPESGGMPGASVKHGWGPLVGNPGVVVPGSEQNTPQPWTSGLRYDVGTKAWFWPYNQAPDWARAPEDQKRLAKAVLDYNAKVTAAATDAAAQAAADQLAAEQAAALQKQQAAEDANTAHQQDQELQAAQQQAAVQAVADQQAQDTQSASDMSQQQLQAAQSMSDVEAQSAADSHAADLAARMEQAAEEREFELARRLDEAQAAQGDQTDQGDGGGATDDGGDQTEQGPEGFNMDEDVMGAIQAVEQLHGSARIHARRDARRGD